MPVFDLLSVVIISISEGWVNRKQSECRDAAMVCVRIVTWFRKRDSYEHPQGEHSRFPCHFSDTHTRRCGLSPGVWHKSAGVWECVGVGVPYSYTDSYTRISCLSIPRRHKLTANVTKRPLDTPGGVE